MLIGEGMIMQGKFKLNLVCIKVFHILGGYALCKGLREV